MDRVVEKQKTDEQKLGHGSKNNKIGQIFNGNEHSPMLGWMIHHDAEAKSLIAESDTSGKWKIDNGLYTTLGRGKRKQFLRKRSIVGKCLVLRAGPVIRGDLCVCPK